MSSPERSPQSAIAKGIEMRPRVIVRSLDRPLAGLTPKGRVNGTFIPGRPEYRVTNPADTIHVPTDKLVTAIKRDRVILGTLADREEERRRDHTPIVVNGVEFRHPELGTLVQQVDSGKSEQQIGHTSKGMEAITEHLRNKGALDLKPRNGHKVIVSGEEVNIKTIGATETNVNGDMSSKFWIRDQALIGKSLFELWRRDPEKYKAEGEMARDVLMSTMHLMSTDAQLERFQNIISSDDPEYKADMRNWPQIAIEGDKLDSKEATKWRHKQEAWQMLGISVLDALDAGLINQADLKTGNKTFLRSMAPFLESVDFTTVENSGTWEEGAVRKTSVMAVETALLNRISQVSEKEGFAFLYEDEQHAPFKAKVDRMVHQGLEVLGKRIPFESPDYPPDDVRFRSADAALFYVLDYGVPQLLAKHNIEMAANNGQPMTARAIEKIILDQLASLDDPRTHALRRYGATGDITEDTYLSKNFTTDKAQLYVNAVKAKVEEEANGGPIDTNRKNQLRQTIVETGSPAGWVHPRFQLAAYGAGMYLETGDDFYLDMAMSNTDFGLANITGPWDHHALWNGESHDVVQAEPYRIAEAIMAMSNDGSTFTVPSPHTPLNWGIAEAIRALGVTTMAAREHEKKLVLRRGVVHPLFQAEA